VLVGVATLGLALLGVPTLPLAPAMTSTAIIDAGYAMPTVPVHLSQRVSPGSIWLRS
jgi:hypothetical protein